MRKITQKIYLAAFFLIALTAGAQISTGTGGAANVQANIPSTNPNVGIGTNNPTSKLEVVGDAKVSSLTIAGSLPNGQTFSSIADRNVKSIILNVGNVVSGTSPAYRMFKIFDFPQSNLDAKPLLWFGLEDRNDFGRFRMLAETGGYTQLEILNKSQEELVKINEDGNNNVYMHFPKPNSRIVIGGFGDYLPEHKFVVRGSAKIEGNILTDSNIGIGTSSFTDGTTIYKLSVKGKVRAEEVKVYNTWADYVFQPDYALPNLKEVENYIAKNGHLQNVPSAKEVTENGLALGEMAKIQQEKIEELTLYLIQQNKELTKQNSEIEELKAQVKILLAQKK